MSNIVIEGVPGFGKSTLVKNLSNQLVGSIPFFEGDYNPIDLAWCSYLNEDEYNGLLNRFDKLKPEIIRNKYKEANMYIVTYTKIRAEESFYREFEQYEIYSGRKSFEALNQIVYKRL